MYESYANSTITSDIIEPYRNTLTSLASLFYTQSSTYSIFNNYQRIAPLSACQLVFSHAFDNVISVLINNKFKNISDANGAIDYDLERTFTMITTI